MPAEVGQAPADTMLPDHSTPCHSSKLCDISTTCQLDHVKRDLRDILAEISDEDIPRENESIFAVCIM